MTPFRSIWVKSSVPNWSRTPASSAEASGTGIRFMIRSNQPVTPLITMSTADSRNAPTA